MATPVYRLLSVVRTEQLSPNMLRLCLSGDDLIGFPEASTAGYIKLIFDLDGNAVDSKSRVEQVSLKQLLRRTYTLSHFDAKTNELWVDFVLHGTGADAGPASNWAQQAVVGSQIVISGPGLVKLVDNQADWFFLAGDMTGLPAIRCNLQQLPATAVGYVVLEIEQSSDQQTLLKPDGVKIYWVVKNTQVEALITSVRAMPWLAGTPAVWVACEFNNMRMLRQYFKKERCVGRDEMYISSYWKTGCSEDQHKLEKRADAALEV